MRFVPGGPLVKVQWFFAADRAPFIGFPTPFYSRNWEDASEKFDAVGEQSGRRQWVNGQRLFLLDGQQHCDDDEALQHGLTVVPAAIRPVTLAGVPLCCFEPSPFVCSAVGFRQAPTTVWGHCGAFTFSGLSRWQAGSGWRADGAVQLGGSASWSTGGSVWTSSARALVFEGSASWVTL